MTLPPPPDPYGSQPPQGGGQPGGGVPPQWGSQQGGVPPQGFGGYGPPPQGQWGPQQQWPSGPGGQPPKSGKGKWILGGIAVVLAIALAVVITVLVVRPADGGGGNGDPTQQNGDSEFASADDTGPVNIITEDPTCGAWVKIAQTVADGAKAVNWADRDQSIPATSWTAEQKSMYDSMGPVMTRAADQTLELSTRTPHRVMRELYQQYIAYSGLFVEKIPSYIAQDGNVAVVADTIANALSNICSAIDFGSAPAVAPLVPDPKVPSGTVGPSLDENPPVMLATRSTACEKWEAAGERFNTDTENWRQIDPSIPAANWSPEQRAANEAVGPIMSTNADELDSLARQFANPAAEDIAVLAAQYRRGFVAALPTYTSADNFLSQTAARLVRTINWACKAAK
ncbi:hypothetical protein [Mycobacterium sp. NPDC050041]|uniref:hypothetical protein n=1 Tax=Mycobacterium sp. NPDC050041 TaxID=3364293 RepID=UPI003C2ABA6A